MKQKALDAGLITIPSPPARGRGLKHQCPTTSRQEKVAPRTGAWIETTEHALNHRRGLVAPRTGAWIETRQLQLSESVIMSPPARGRGLKPVLFAWTPGIISRPPHGGVD